jgi:phage terminase large subunit-like protein
MIALDKPTPKQVVEEYIAGVLDGSVVAGKLVRYAVQRHVNDLKGAKERGYYFDEAVATRACRFFPECLVHSIGEWDGQPFHLSPWQMFVVWCVFGWRETITGFRRFRKLYASVARKNGKTTLIAGMALLLMFADEPFEPAAELYVAATKEDQAKIMHREAVRMVQGSKALAKRATVRKVPASIQWTAKDSFFKPIGGDSNSTDGLNPHAVLEDELHAWGERHRGLKEKLATGGGARRQPLEIMITTAGDDRSQIWREEDDYAAKVVESVISGNDNNDKWFVFIARLDDGDDVWDEANWPKANPNYAISVKPQYIRDAADTAKAKPSETNQFIRYHTNRQVASSQREISPELWATGSRPLTVQAGASCHGGVDLARSDDWAAVSLCFPIYEDGQVVRWEVKSTAWTCRHGLFDISREPIRGYIHDGLLRVCDGNQIDFSEIEREIVKLSKEYDVKTWAFDPNRGKELMQRLQQEHGIQPFEFTQAARFYNEPCVRLLAELKAGNFIHGNDPVLGWQAGNLYFHRDTEGLVKPDKSQRANKIDGMVATLMSFSECLFAEKQDQGDLFITAGRK